MQRVLQHPDPPSQRRPRHGHAAARRRAARRGGRRLRGSRPRRSAIKLGEGITGKVVESGKPIVVPRVSREPAFLNCAPRRGDSLAAGAQLHLRADHAATAQAVGALAVDLRFKAGARLRQQREVLRHRQLDDRAGAQRAAAWSRRSAGACSTRTRTCGRSCASATTSRTSSAPAGRRGRCTSRSRRSRRPTPPC